MQFEYKFEYKIFSLNCSQTVLMVISFNSEGAVHQYKIPIKSQFISGILFAIPKLKYL